MYRDMREAMRALVVAGLVVAGGCAATEPRPALANHGGHDYVDLAWHAQMDDRDWVQVTVVVDGTAYAVGPAGGPDDDGDTAPSGCTSEPDKANPEVQMFYCGAASRWYAARLADGEVVVTRFDQWLEPHRLTTSVVRRVRLHGTKLYVLAYHAS